MIKKMALALALCVGAALGSVPAAASPLGTAGRSIDAHNQGAGLVEQVHWRRWHRHHYGYYNYYAYGYRPYYYHPYRYNYYPRYSYYSYPYYPYYRYHRHHGVSVYLNF